MGQKKSTFVETQAIIHAFTKTQPTTPQTTTHLNHHNNSDVVLFSIVQYTLNTWNFAKCKIIMQTSKQ